MSNQPRGRDKESRAGCEPYILGALRSNATYSGVNQSDSSPQKMGLPAEETPYQPSGFAPWVTGTAADRNLMMTRKKEKMEMPVCTRVTVSKFRTLEAWCDNTFRKRSEVVGIVLERVLELLEQHSSVDQPVEEFARRLRTDSEQ